MKTGYPYIDSSFDFDEKTTSNFVKYRLKNEIKPTFDFLVELIANMPIDKFGISFFDFYHPTLSDPGAYINIAKYKTEIVYTKGNHGWTADWFFTNSKRMAAYILKNWQHLQDPFFLSDYSWNPKNPQKTERVFRNQIRHISDNIFELNGEYLLENNLEMYHTDKFDFNYNFKQFEFINEIDFSHLERIDII